MIGTGLTTIAVSDIITGIAFIFSRFLDAVAKNSIFWQKYYLLMLE